MYIFAIVCLSIGGLLLASAILMLVNILPLSIIYNLLGLSEFEYRPFTICFALSFIFDSIGFLLTGLLIFMFNNSIELGVYIFLIIVPLIFGIIFLLFVIKKYKRSDVL